MPTPQNREIIAAKVRARAAERRVTIRALARATDMEYSAMLRRTRGDVDFTAGELAVVARALDADPAVFFPTTEAVAS